jgi:hypothetical protein
MGEEQSRIDTYDGTIRTRGDVKSSLQLAIFGPLKIFSLLCTFSEIDFVWSLARVSRGYYRVLHVFNVVRLSLFNSKYWYDIYFKRKAEEV